MAELGPTASQFMFFVLAVLANGYDIWPLMRDSDVANLGFCWFTGI